VIAASLDIQNTFNSLPWESIRKALEKKGFPLYIRGIVNSYLSGRSINYTNEKGEIRSYPMQAGVPQGSVLGPILWNITYDEVLAGSCVKECRVIGYADDTLVLAEAEQVNVAVARANVQTGLVLNRIGRLGLTIAAQKTEVVCFAERQRIERIPTLDVEGTIVEAKRKMKYLGVMLDDKLSFGTHLEYIEDKVSKVTSAAPTHPEPEGPGRGEKEILRERRSVGDALRGPHMEGSNYAGTKE